MSAYDRPRHGPAVSLHVDSIRDGVGAEQPGTYGWEQSYSARLQREQAERLQREQAERGSAIVNRGLRSLGFDETSTPESYAETVAAMDPIALDPMTDAQRAFLADLIVRAGDEMYASLDLDDVDRRLGSRLIDELKSLVSANAAPPRFWARVAPAPVRDPLPIVPAGRYAVEVDGVLRFYRVRVDDAGRFAGLSAQASEQWYPVVKYDARRVVLDAILAAGARAAAERYGREIGRCGCCGRVLTDATSRANGLGPDCVEHFGTIGAER